MEKEIRELVEKLDFEDYLLNRENYKNSAVLVPLIKTERGLEIVFEKRSQFIVQPGEICFPGGGFDSSKDKDYMDCAIRECSEELMIDRSIIKIHKHLPSLINPTGHILEVFLGELLEYDINKINPNSQEVEKIFSVPISWFKENKPKEFYVESEVKNYRLNEQKEKEITLPIEKFNFAPRYKKPWGRKKHKMYLYEYEKEIIWGMTAYITNKIINKL